MNHVEYLLMKVAEEAGEVAQMAGKSGVFGLYDQDLKYGNLPNIDLLIAEVNDLIAVTEMLSDYCVDISNLGSRANIALKKQKVKKWMIYSQEKGTLDES